MNRYILLFLTMFICSCSISASEELIPYYDNGLYGYFNSEKTIVIKPKYPLVTSFANKFATAKVAENKFVVINDLGEELFQFMSQRSYPDPFRDGFVLFREDRKYGFLDLNGDVIFSNYDFASSYSDGFAVIRQNRKYYFMDTSGKFLKNKSNQDLAFDEAASFDHGLAKVGIEVDGSMVYGFIDISGAYVISPKFQYLENKFTEGLCGAALETGNGRGDIASYGFINKSGEWVISPQYYEVRTFSGEVAPVRYKENEYFGPTSLYWKLVDKNGKEVRVLDDTIMSIGDFTSGLASFIFQDENKSLKYGYINELGEIVIDPIIENAYTSFHNGFCSVNIQGRDAIITTAGDIFFNEEFFN